MSLYVYRPDQIKISIGLPNLDLATLLNDPQLENFESSFTLADWIDFQPTKISRFSLTRGVLGEPFLEYNSDTSRTYNLTLLQTSNDVIKLRNLFFLQTFGIIGWPLFINDLSNQNLTTERLLGIDINAQRQKTINPVAIILDEEEGGFSLDGATRVFRIGVTYSQTVFV